MNRKELLSRIALIGFIPNGPINEIALQLLLGEVNADCKVDTRHVTRFQVIDHKTGGTGLVYAVRPCSVALSYQDNGKTLKVFLTDPPVGCNPQG